MRWQWSTFNWYLRKFISIVQEHIYCTMYPLWRFGDIYRIICLNCMVTLPLRRKKNRIIFGNQICVKLHWNGCFLSKHFRSWRQSSGVDKKMSCRENEPFSFVMESGIIKFIYNLFIFHQLEEIIIVLATTLSFML